jgi:acyl dehydratase
MSAHHERSLTITDDLIRAYSRRGNYHSDASVSESLGLPGLVAQGLQVAGPAYGLLLDEWGEEFLAHGEIDLRFVGVVLAGGEICAHVDIDDGTATIEVVLSDTHKPATVGTARRIASAP